MKAASFILAAMLATTLALPCFAYLCSPLGRQGKHQWCYLCSTSALPDDGTPMLLAVVVPQFDAWTRMSDELQGFAFARRIPKSGEVTVLNANNTRGVRMRHDRKNNRYQCPCWNLSFGLDGKLLRFPDPTVEMRRQQVHVENGEVFVRVPMAMMPSFED